MCMLVSKTGEKINGIMWYEYKILYLPDARGPTGKFSVKTMIRVLPFAFSFTNCVMVWTIIGCSLRRGFSFVIGNAPIINCWVAKESPRTLTSVVAVAALDVASASLPQLSAIVSKISESISSPKWLITSPYSPPQTPTIFSSWYISESTAPINNVVSYWFDNGPMAALSKNEETKFSLTAAVRYRSSSSTCSDDNGSSDPTAGSVAANAFVAGFFGWSYWEKLVEGIKK